MHIRKKALSLQQIKTNVMKYKVGDKVLIKSADWYYENRDEENTVHCGSAGFVSSMTTFCGQIVTISSVSSEKSSFKIYQIYRIKEDNGIYNWTDEMIEGIFAEENKPLTFGDSWECPQGYQFVDENGNVINAQKIALEKKKKEYPKTYGECCEILGVDPNNFLTITNCYEGEVETTNYERSLSSKFTSLLGLIICRDAYWKIAGEEMGLGNPWKPDWENSEERRYSIVNIEGDINLPETTLTKWILKVTNKILVFPTIEMRDAFYENFKDLIEICKELL